MYLYKIQVDRITPEQIDAIHQIVPSLEVKPVNTVDEALEAAIQKVNPLLGYREFVSSVELALVPESGVIKVADRKHFIQQTESGWTFHILIAGD